MLCPWEGPLKRELKHVWGWSGVAEPPRQNGVREAVRCLRLEESQEGLLDDTGNS